MDSDAEMMERHGRLLGRYAEQAASLAEDLHACALAAETPEQKQSISLAFHRMGRALRQTLALEAKLRRDAKQEDRLDRAETVKLDKVRTEARRVQVQAAVERRVWAEVEPDDRDDFLQVLAERVEAVDVADPETPVNEIIRRVAEDIGLPDPPPLGEVSAEPTEGASAVESPPHPSERKPPQSLRDSSPEGGASDDHPLYSDDYWSSSA